MSNKIGLIAGNGKLPIAIAEEIRASGHEAHVCAIRGEASESLRSLSNSFEWVKVGQLKKLVQFFKRNAVSEAIMAGKITKSNLLKGEIQPDLDMIKLIAMTKDRKDDTLLGAVAHYLDSKGIRLLSSVVFLEKSLPRAGVLSKQKPTRSDFDEIDFGWKVAKEIAGLDIGQTVVTKNRAIWAVEAIEGTDQAILRGGELAGGGVTVIKVAKPNQDMRFDVPTIGLQTLETLIRIKARMLVFEAGKTILLDRDEFIRKADEHKMILVAK